MFVVRGEFNGQPYAVVHTGRRLDRGRSDPGIVAVLKMLAGESWQVTVTGPTVTLDSLDDGLAVLVALRQHTTVSQVVGDAPELDTEVPAGAVA